MNEENFKNEWKYCSVKNLRGQEWYIPSDCAACVPLSKVFGSATQRPRGMHFGNRSKAPGKKPPRQKPPGQKPPDNKPPRIIEVIITKYAFDAYLFRLGSTDPKKNPAPGFFFRACIPGTYCRKAFVRVAFVRGFLSGGFWPRTDNGYLVTAALGFFAVGQFAVKNEKKTNLT